MRVDNADGSVVQFAYDALGVRKSKTVTGNGTSVTVQFVTASFGGLSHMLAEFTTSPASPTKSYIYAGHQQIAQVLGSGLEYLLHDGYVGSVTHATSATGSVLAQYDYDAFGVPYGPAIAGYGYTGEEYDSETGLLYLRARYYDPTLGKFISADPYWGRLEEPVTQNRYVYVHNNPLSYVDPTGLASDSKDLAISVSGFTAYGQIQTSKVTFSNGDKATLVEFGFGKTTAVEPAASIAYGGTHTTANSASELSGHGYTTTIDGALFVMDSLGLVFGNGCNGYTYSVGATTTQGVTLTGVKTYTIVLPEAVPPTWISAGDRSKAMDHGIKNKLCTL